MKNKEQRDNLNNYRLRGRIWLEAGDSAVLGAGKAELLRRTAGYGSLRKAALSLGISYRQAWYSINKLNNVTDRPLIVLQHGGKNGGVARLTEFGSQVIEMFEKSQREFETFLDEQTGHING